MSKVTKIEWNVVLDGEYIQQNREVLEFCFVLFNNRRMECTEILILSVLTIGPKVNCMHRYMQICIQ